ncbi:MAG: type II toxin-antitoxin system RelE/ParE family toxin [Verrucomicrobiota bacterium]
MKWVFKKEARDKFRETYQWYDEKSSKAGDNFIDEFNALIGEICQNPERWPPFYSERFRKATMRRFPYQVIYRISEKQITVMIIRHEKRRRSYGLERL